MKIALDYDGTYTEDPGLWDVFIYEAFENGHDVRFVTWRHFESDTITLPVYLQGVPIIYCDGMAKKMYCASQGWEPNVWIDDHPEAITTNQTWTADQLNEWRENGRV